MNTNMSNGGPSMSGLGRTRMAKKLHPSVRFRMEQACEASLDRRYQALTPDSVAYKVATGILLAFPEIRVPVGSQANRTALAYHKVVRSLSGKEIRDTEGLAQGKRIATQALCNAYEIVDSRSKKPTKVPSPTVLADKRRLEPVPA